MEKIIREIGERLHGLREILDISEDEMAQVTGTTRDENLSIESGQKDFTFTFLYKAANRFGLDLTELMTGESPHLTGYSLVRKGDGLPIERRAGFRYLNLASRFHDRIAESFMVEAPYAESAESQEIVMSNHPGQEMDYVISGSLRVRIGQHEETMYEGDTLYYDSGRSHGMVAIGGSPCSFLAIIFKANANVQQDQGTC